MFIKCKLWVGQHLIIIKLNKRWCFLHDLGGWVNQAPTKLWAKGHDALQWLQATTLQNKWYTLFNRLY